MGRKKKARTGGTLAIIGFFIILIIGCIFLIDTYVTYKENMDYSKIEDYYKRVLFENCLGSVGIFLGFFGMSFVAKGFYEREKKKNRKRAMKYRGSCLLLRLGSIILLISVLVSTGLTFMAYEDNLDIERVARIRLLAFLDLMELLGLSLCFLGIGFFGYGIAKKDKNQYYEKEIEPFVIEPMDAQEEETTIVGQEKRKKIIFKPLENEVIIECPSCDKDFPMDGDGELTNEIECPHCHYVGKFE